MDIQGFRRVPDNESAEFGWAREVVRATERGLMLTNLEIIGHVIDETTGDSVYKAVKVYDHATGKLLGRYSPEEFDAVNYDEEGWFDANGPYDPHY